MVKSFAVLTSGGDAPGMNAAIRAVVRTGLGKGARSFGVSYGYEGLIAGEISEMSSVDVGGIIGRGGTTLRSARSKRFRETEGRVEAAESLRKYEIEGLVVIGGDGSLRGAMALSEEHGIPVMGVPASIDNDIPRTVASVGFDTAVNTALEAIDRIRDTAYSHDRVFVIEVMGRRNGFIAVEAGLAGGAEAILIPEVPYDIGEVAKRLVAGTKRGKRSSIIVVAEGAASASEVQDFLIRETGYEVRCVVLGHMQRGGNPTSFDRVLGTRLGAAAVKSLLDGVSGEMAGFDGKDIFSQPLSEVFSQERKFDTSRLKLAEEMSM